MNKKYSIITLSNASIGFTLFGNSVLLSQPSLLDLPCYVLLIVIEILCCMDFYVSI